VRRGQGILALTNDEDELAVASDTGGNLADLRQYVPATTTIKTYAGDDCFDPTPPIKQSSGASYPMTSPTMLSAPR